MSVTGSIHGRCECGAYVVKTAQHVLVFDPKTNRFYRRCAKCLIKDEHKLYKAVGR